MRTPLFYVAFCRAEAAYARAEAAYATLWARISVGLGSSLAVADASALSLAFTSDGRRLIFVRGGGPNQWGEIPNPTSDPGGATQAIYAALWDDGSTKRLAVGSDPVVSPSGDQVVFTHQSALWVVSLHALAKKVKRSTEAITLLFASRISMMSGTVRRHG